MFLRMDGDDILTVPLHPTALFGVMAAIAVVGHALLPWSFWDSLFVWRVVGGMFLLLAAFGVGWWAIGTLRGRKQSPDFDRSVTALVEAGPYRSSRNLLYVVLLANCVGFAILLGNAWFVVGTLGLGIALDRLVIVRKERFLLARFGSEYADYAQRERQWQ
jgi:protein-S-isoprenylcysteine O-methyltransferase Ste14